MEHIVFEKKNLGLIALFLVLIAAVVLLTTEEEHEEEMPLPDVKLTEIMPHSTQPNADGKALGFITLTNQTEETVDLSGWGLADRAYKVKYVFEIGTTLAGAGEYDVLFLGDSIMNTGVFPMEMWEKYGIAGYNIASYGNTLPITYWALQNALDYAKPKLVVLDVQGVSKSYKLSGNSSDVHTAFDCYSISKTKIEALDDLMDDPNAVDDDGVAYVDMKWEYLFTLGKYHARWSELTDTDFHPVYNREKGAKSVIAVADVGDYDLIDEDMATEESGQTGFVYLRKIIEDCQARGIDVLLVHLPYPANEQQQMDANAVAYIAEDYGLNYIDFVSMDQVADYATDCFDAHEHLNPSGARKVSDYLGRYITEHYDVDTTIAGMWHTRPGRTTRRPIVKRSLRILKTRANWPAR